MNRDVLNNELKLKALRSSGAGGQHVNKVSTKIELQFDLENSAGLTSEEKAVISEKISNRINKSGIIVMQCDETRSQFRNKQILIDRFFGLIETALIPKKKRKPTKIPKKAAEKRLDEKKRKSQKKQSRQNPEY
ncbi:MAG: aminoacyl-tRNA hydrolase [Flavobacteriaceae bacterium]|nr:aminoacyl-tRNA hydrolase [Flavobacteriaceae bacterium]